MTNKEWIKVPSFFTIIIEDSEWRQISLLVDKETRVQYLVRETTVYWGISNSMTVYVDANNKPILYEWDIPEE